jgi:hypothetical protein
VKKPEKAVESDSDVLQGAIVDFGDTSPEIVDQEGLQLMDECNKERVEAYRKEVEEHEPTAQQNYRWKLTVILKA